MQQIFFPLFLQAAAKSAFSILTVKHRVFFLTLISSALCNLTAAWSQCRRRTRASRCGQCRSPRELVLAISLRTNYSRDADARDLWTRRVRMRCGAVRVAGAVWTNLNWVDVALQFSLCAVNKPLFMDVKTFFYVFLFWSRFFTFLRLLFSKRFLFLKSVGKVQSGKQINKKHFQNNSNEIDVWFFRCMSNIEDVTASLKRRQFTIRYEMLF